MVVFKGLRKIHSKINIIVSEQDLIFLMFIVY